MSCNIKEIEAAIKQLEHLKNLDFTLSQDELAREIERNLYSPISILEEARDVIRDKATLRNVS